MARPTEEAFKLIEQNAEMSGNKKSFIEGLVFGLGMAYAIDDKGQPVMATTEVLLDHIDKRYRKLLNGEEH